MTAKKVAKTYVVRALAEEFNTPWCIAATLEFDHEFFSCPFLGDETNFPVSFTANPFVSLTTKKA